MKTRVVRITKPGGPEVLELADGEVREPGPGEVLVAVEAAGLNRADCLQRRGVYPAPPSYPADIPGLELAGSVEKVGEGGSWSKGDRVMCITGGGAMATHVVVHERELVAIPRGLSTVDAAAVPEVFMTSFDALFRQANVGLGSTVLVHAVASGIGTAATQLVRAAGGVSIGTSRSAVKLERCRALGLDHPIDAAGGTFADQVREVVPHGVDVVLDTIGAKYLKENVAVLATRGTVIVIGLLGGVAGELSLGALLQKRATITGSVLRSRPLEEKAALAQAFRSQVLPLFERGALNPVIDAVLSMRDVADAHRRMEASETFGKLVLRWD